MNIQDLLTINKIIQLDYIRPIEPAVNPTTKKNANSVKSLGIEFTKRLTRVILPCAPQV